MTKMNDDTSMVHVDLTLAKDESKSGVLGTDNSKIEPDDASLVKFQDELTEGIKYNYQHKSICEGHSHCSIPGCNQPAYFRCDKTFKFTSRWKACGRRLCYEHSSDDFTGASRCHSFPKTSCELQYDIATKANRKEFGYCLLMLFFLVLLVCFMFIFKIPIFEFDTELWRILVNEQSNFRFLTPLHGNYTNTFIWLHDYNENTQVAQSFFYHDTFFAESTKVVLVESPFRDMGYEILGEKGLEELAWFNMN